MKLAQIDLNGSVRVGRVVDGEITLFHDGITVSDLLARWSVDPASLGESVTSGESIPLGEARILPPISRPGKIFAIGLNYADHIAEMNLETPKHQVWFTKAVTSVNGPYAPVLISRTGKSVDYEVELVAVIGKRGKHISRENAAAHVFGYCVGNDVSERDWQMRTPQWSLGKSFDTHAPIGPWITTKDEIPDPHALGIRAFVNGEKRQDSNTRHLVFDLWDQIAELSQAVTLEPGDLIFTGTPGGVGVAMTPKQFLTAGDVVRCEIDKLGAIEAKLVGED